MIVVDLEMSGMNYEKCGIVEVGAIDLDSGEEFFQESRLDEGDEVIDQPDLSKGVLEVLGKTEEELRDKNKKDQKEVLKTFFDWCKQVKTKNFVCMHPHADVAFLEHKARKYGLEFPFKSYKVFDLHSVAQVVYLNLNKNFLIGEYKGEIASGMGLKDILKFVGIDTAVPHNALGDAKLEAECFSRLVYGKSLLKEFEKFEIPGYLLK